MLFRSRKKLSREISLYEPIGTDKEGNEINLLDIIEGAEVDVAGQMDLREEVKRLYQVWNQVLKEREKGVLALRYGMFGREEKTQREIADMLGISRSYVSRIEKNALKKLKNAF